MSTTSRSGPCTLCSPGPRLPPRFSNVGDGARRGRQCTQSRRSPIMATGQTLAVSTPATPTTDTSPNPRPPFASLYIATRCARPSGP